jgi:hypothetical protein
VIYFGVLILDQPYLKLMAEEDTTVVSEKPDSLFRDEEKMEESANVAYLLTLGILLGLALRELNKKTKYITLNI